MPEQAARPCHPRPATRDPTGFAVELIECLGALFAAAAGTVCRNLPHIRATSRRLADGARTAMRRVSVVGRSTGRANRGEDSSAIGEGDGDRQSIDGRWRRSAEEGIARAATLVATVAGGARAGLVWGSLLASAAAQAVWRRIAAFRRDGEVSLGKVEAAFAMLVFASVGFSFAWLSSGIDLRDRARDGPGQTPSADVGREAVERHDPSISSIGFARLMVERPDLEGRFLWPEQSIPIPLFAQALETRRRDMEQPLPASHPSVETNAAPPQGVGAPSPPSAGAAPPATGAASVSSSSPALPSPSPSSSGASRVNAERSSRTVVNAPAASTQRSAGDQQRPAAMKSGRADIREAPVAPSGAHLRSPAPSGGTASGVYQVQLVAVGARKDALRVWQQLSDRHQDVLGDLEPDVSSRRTRNRNLVYRLRAGPIDSRNDANALCAVLAKRKVDCLVIRASS